MVDVFFGEYRHNLDAKGRIIVPAKFREGLGGKFYVTRGMDGCLFVYAENEWNLLQEKLQKLPLARKEARAFVRFFYSAATECILDKQGRINLPKTLCDYAELVKPCVFIGVSNRIELKFGLNNVGKKHRNRRQKVLTIWQKICLILDCR